MIVDSVQTVSSSLIDGAAGQPSQVREVAATLIRIAKDRDPVSYTHLTLPTTPYV